MRGVPADSNDPVHACEHSSAADSGSRGGQAGARVCLEVLGDLDLNHATAEVVRVPPARGWRAPAETHAASKQYQILCVAIQAISCHIFFRVESYRKGYMISKLYMLCFLLHRGGMLIVNWCVGTLGIMMPSSTKRKKNILSKL
jgi:hypothetical protein